MVGLDGQRSAPIASAIPALPRCRCLAAADHGPAKIMTQIRPGVAKHVMRWAILRFRTWTYCPGSSTAMNASAQTTIVLAKLQRKLRLVLLLVSRRLLSCCQPSTTLVAGNIHHRDSFAASPMRRCHMSGLCPCPRWILPATPVRREMP
jgi:hypothetical protein